ncbi:hypothetical protein D3C72_1859660 [compost metagenome]
MSTSLPGTSDSWRSSARVDGIVPHVSAPTPIFLPFRSLIVLIGPSASTASSSSFDGIAL